MPKDPSIIQFDLHSPFAWSRRDDDGLGIGETVYRVGIMAGIPFEKSKRRPAIRFSAPLKSTRKTVFGTLEMPVAATQLAVFVDHVSPIGAFRRAVVVDPDFLAGFGTRNWAMSYYVT